MYNAYSSAIFLILHVNEAGMQKWLYNIYYLYIQLICVVIVIWDTWEYMLRTRIGDLSFI